jgi:hemoglobin-like flavoprotein
MKHQHASLISALVVVIQELLDPTSLQSRLLQLGRRHYYYGATPANYTHVGESMMAALRVHLGEKKVSFLNEHIHTCTHTHTRFLTTTT